MNAKEEQHFHNTYHFEQKLLQYIQNGDVEKMKTLLNTPSKLSGGLMADNSLRQEKNVFITTVAIVTRSAIAGGIDMEQAYQLADVYIRECEKLQCLWKYLNVFSLLLTTSTNPFGLAM